MSVGNAFLRAQEIAVELGVNESTVHRWINQGKLPAYRFVDTVRVDPGEYEKFKRQGKIRRRARQPAEHVYVIGPEDQRLVKIG